MVYGMLITRLLKDQKIVLSAPSIPIDKIKFLNVGTFKRMTGEVMETLKKYTEEHGANWRTKKKDSKRKSDLVVGESSRPIKKGKKQQTEDSDYVPSGFKAPTLVKPIVETASEVGVYRKFKSSMSKITTDSSDYVPPEDSEVVSVSVNLVKESAKLLKQVIKDAEPEIEHAKKAALKRKLKVFLENSDDENEQEVSSELAKLAKLKKKAVEKPVGLVRSPEGKISVVRGPKKVLCTKKKIVGSSSLPRNLFPPPSPSVLEEVTTTPSSIDITNVVRGIVQDVTHLFEVEAPLPQINVEDSIDVQEGVADIHSDEPIVPLVPSPQPDDTWRFLPVVLGEEHPLEPSYIIERSYEIDDTIYTQQYGFFYANQIGTLTSSLIPLVTYYPFGEVYFFKTLFIFLVCHFVPLSYSHLMLQYIPQIFYKTLVIPRLEWNKVTPNFIPEYARWIGVKRNYCIGFTLSSEPWAQEMALQRDEAVRLFGQYLAIDSEFHRIELERATVWRRLMRLNLHAASISP